MSVDQEALIAVGEEVSKTVRFSERDIATFATICGDWNPLHFDQEAASLSRYGRKIASGAHTSALLMGLAMSHFSRGHDGLPREALALNYNVAFKAPVFAEEDVKLYWKVSSREWNTKLSGWVAQAEGVAITPHSESAVIARATLLVRAKIAPATSTT